MNWTYQGKEFTENDIPSGVIGFVYCIEELNTGKKYIGKKLFWKTVKRKPRGVKRAKKVQVQSDWKKYYGSSNDLKERLVEHGEDNFKRTILHMCKSKTELSYMELKEQIDRNVLFDDSYYNDFIGVKIRGINLK